MNKIRWGILGAAKIAREHLVPAIQLSANDIARVTARITGSSTVEEIICPQADHYQLMIENFHAAMHGDEPLRFPLESSRANQRVIDMIFAAATPYPHVRA